MRQFRPVGLPIPNQWVPFFVNKVNFLPLAQLWCRVRFYSTKVQLVCCFEPCTIISLGNGRFGFVISRNRIRPGDLLGNL
jgi:hypothetical protein